MEIVKLKLGVERAQFNKGRFPEKYTQQNKMGLYSQEEKQEAIAGAFNFGSNVWLDASPFDAEGNKLEREAVKAAGLFFWPKWTVAFVPEAGGVAQTCTVVGNGTGVEIEGIDGILGVGGESADESGNYHVRFHLDGQGTYTFRVELKVGERTFSAERTLKAS